MKDRLDKKLVELGLASTRSQALQYIQAGIVFEGETPLTKAAYKTDGKNLTVQGDTHYVGRGAYKLLEALQHIDVTLKDKLAADVGASTGGFTQVLLERGAQKVFAIDVGRDQLDARIKNDDRVIDMSGVNIRDVKELPQKLDIVVADLSFISLELVLKPMAELLKPDGELIVLVKPQFEVGKDALNKQGVVSDLEKHFATLVKIKKSCESLNLGLMGAVQSSTIGKIGNQEYLYWLRVNQSSVIQEEDLRELCR